MLALVVHSQLHDDPEYNLFCNGSFVLLILSGGIVPLSRPTPDHPFSLSHAQSIPRYVQVLSMCFLCDFNGKLDILSPKQK